MRAKAFDRDRHLEIPEELLTRIEALFEPVEQLAVNKGHPHKPISVPAMFYAIIELGIMQMEQATEGRHHEYN